MHRAAHQVAVYEHALSASEGLCGELCLLESVLKIRPLLLFRPNSYPYLTINWCLFVFEVNIMMTDVLLYQHFML